MKSRLLLHGWSVSRKQWHEPGRDVGKFPKGVEILWCKDKELNNYIGTVPILVYPNRNNSRGLSKYGWIRHGCDVQEDRVQWLLVEISVEGEELPGRWVCVRTKMYYGLEDDHGHISKYRWQRAGVVLRVRVLGFKPVGSEYREHQVFVRTPSSYWVWSDCLPAPTKILFGVVLDVFICCTALFGIWTSFVGKASKTDCTTRSPCGRLSKTCFVALSYCIDRKAFAWNLARVCVCRQMNSTSLLW